MLVDFLGLTVNTPLPYLLTEEVLLDDACSFANKFALTRWDRVFLWLRACVGNVRRVSYENEDGAIRGWIGRDGHVYITSWKPRA